MFNLNRGLFCVSCSTSAEVHKKEEGKHSHDSWAKLARGISHTIENPAQNINWASYPDGVWHQSVGGKQLYCALVYFFLLSLFATRPYFTSLQLLNCSYLNMKVLLLLPLPFPSGWGAVSDSCVAASCGYTRMLTGTVLQLTPVTQRPLWNTGYIYFIFLSLFDDYSKSSNHTTKLFKTKYNSSLFYLCFANP